MKKITLVVAVMVLVTGLLTGCGAHFGNEAQYKDGDWYFLASSADVARIQRDKLALEKLKEQGMLASQEAGKKGLKVIVANMDRYRPINTKLYGPETGSWLISPNSWEEIYLIPGTYTAISYDGGNVVGRWTFEVGPPVKKYMGKEVYGYTYYRGY